MTSYEKHCFAIMKNWKRRAIWRSFKYRVRPALPAKDALRNSGVVIHTLYIFFLIAFSPLIVLWWLLRALLGLIILPIEYLRTLRSVKNLHAPGERNIQGVHNAFAKYFDLPIDLYLNCIDEWIYILYPDRVVNDLTTSAEAKNIGTRNIGTRKIETKKDPSIKQHIDPQIIDYREEIETQDQGFHDYAKSQVSRARE